MQEIRNAVSTAGRISVPDPRVTVSAGVQAIVQVSVSLARIKFQSIIPSNMEGTRQMDAGGILRFHPLASDIYDTQRKQNTGKRSRTDYNHNSGHQPDVFRMESATN